MTDETKTAESIGGKIKRLRKDGGVSQEELAAEIGVTANTVSRWEKDIISPASQNLMAIARFFGVSADYFFCGKDGGETALKSETASEISRTETIETEENIPDEAKKETVPRPILIVLIIGAALFFGGNAALLYCVFAYQYLPQGLQGAKLSFNDNMLSVDIPLPTLIILLLLLACIVIGLALGIYALVKIIKQKNKKR